MRGNESVCAGVRIITTETVEASGYNRGEMRPAFAMACLVLFAISSAAQEWRLVWSDEFNGIAGAPPDPVNWNYDLGFMQPYQLSNGEIETYTNLPQNAFQDGNGNLIIRAIRDASGNYTSARLQTGAPGASTQTADWSWQYGLIEARMKLPYGQGIWPALWMLGEDFGVAGWPACGEIDIMENFGTFSTPGYPTGESTNSGTLHGPAGAGSSAAYNAQGLYTLPWGERVSDDFHVYAIQWFENVVAFSVDGTVYYTGTPFSSSIPLGQWKFNAPFFILLNLAIGGPNTVWGTPDPNAPFSNQDLVVDYVRVYKAVAAPPQAPVIAPGRVVNAASYLGGVSPGALATVFGNNLADKTYSSPMDANGNFARTAGGVAVTVNGISAPLVYVSANQISFQVPWEIIPGPSVDVQVTRGLLASAVETITVASSASPAMFLEDFTNGIAWMTAPGCETTECSAFPGATYQLWANGLGPKNALPHDGSAALFSGSLQPLELAGGASACELHIGGQPATVTYCGAAPGQIIDQLNFIYPPGVPASKPYADAVLTIGGTTGRFRLPAPTP